MAMRILLSFLLLHSCLAFHTAQIPFPTSSTRTSGVNHDSSPQQQLSSRRKRSQLSPQLSSSVNVYNNVVDNETCKRLHKLMIEHTKRSQDGSSLFYRGSSSQQTNTMLTPIETAIDQILNSLNDTSPMVEYWSRSTYINMDAHADIDENTLKEEGILRCPRNGHVLYMQIANNDHDTSIASNANNRMGPTVVFPTRKVAWGSVTPRTIPSPSMASYNSEINLENRVQEYMVDVENYWDDEQKLQYGYANDDENCRDWKKMDEMAIVPAVNGRLLRFDGAAFHSVPKPPDRYLLSAHELAAFLDKQTQDDGEDDDDDDFWDDYEYDDEDEESKSDTANQRSVILFNTWPEGSSGPRGVLPDRIVDAVPDGISFEESDDDDARGPSREDEQRQQWQHEYGEDFELVACNPVDEWDVVDVNQSRCHSSREVTIPIMGNPSRRGCTETKDILTGSVAHDSFYDNYDVALVTLRKETD